MLKKLLFFICFAVASMPGKAQNYLADSTTTAYILHADSVYNHFIEKQSRLYNGIEHLGYYYRIKGFAYFMNRELQTGSVVYDELEFVNVPMLYDLVKDQVVVRHFNHITLIGLVSEKVSSFTLQNHHFIRLSADSTHGSRITTGFYDEMYTGKLSVLVRRIKVIDEKVKEEVELEFLPNDQYYIKKNNTYYYVRNYKGLLTVLQDKEKDIRKYLRKNRIRFRKDHENAIVKAAAYYDSLTR